MKYPKTISSGMKYPKTISSAMKYPKTIFTNLTMFCKDFYSLTAQVFSQCWKKPVYYRIIIENMYDFGYRSLFIVISLGIAIGTVLTLHIGMSLARYGAKLYVSKIVILSIFGEMGTVLVVFILAGKIGAGITSEIAFMKASEQLDAIKALGVSPIKRVVAPKVIACIIIIPILCILFCVICLLTSVYVATTQLHLDPLDYLMRGLYTPTLSFFLFGIFKTIVFAFFIAITCCHYGLNITKGSYEVGRATMQAVVVSFMLIIFGDLLLAQFYYAFLHIDY